jgi:hypothetical protein
MEPGRHGVEPPGENLLNFTLEQEGDDWTIAEVGPYE